MVDAPVAPVLNEISVQPLTDSQITMRNEVHHTLQDLEGHVVSLTQDTVHIYIKELNITPELHRNSVQCISGQKMELTGLDTSFIPVRLATQLEMENMFTGRCPYIGLQVIASHGPCKGIHATIGAMTVDHNMYSGLNVLLKFEAPTTYQDIVVDYHIVRRCDNGRFVHDSLTPPKPGETIQKVAT